jgi:phosphate:Na+ symporter
MSIFEIFSLFGGIAMFLYGMNVMGDGLKKLGGGKLETILEKLTSNRIMGVLLGAVVTAVIQSSNATTVMVVGFVNSGIMKLSQSLGVMMGANIGTTVTAWILSLSGVQGESVLANMVKPQNFTPILAVIGIVLLMIGKSDKQKSIGNILVGFSVLMFGMETMSSSVSGLKESPAFANLLVMFSNPVLGLLVGVFLTALIQSSSASVGILQALSTTGGITFGTAIPIILGENIGASITALISCIGTSKNAKRAAIANLYIKIISAVLFLVVFYALKAIVGFTFINSPINAVNIAIVHTTFNVVSTIILLPFTGLIEKLVRFTIREGAEKSAFAILDDRFLQTPSFAVDQCMTLTTNMGYIARESVSVAVSLLDKYSEKGDKFVVESEEEVDRYEDVLGSYLVKLSARDLNYEDSQRVSLLLHAMGDFEQISDIAVKLLYTIREINSKKVVFSEKAKCELQIVTNAIFEIMDLTIKAFSENDMEAVDRVEPLEAVIDGLKKELKSRHIHRLQDGKCSVETGFVFSDYISSLEKISDHCSNVAVGVEQFCAQNYELHQNMHIKKKESEYKEMYMHYSKKYALPFSMSGLEREAQA